MSCLWIAPDRCTCVRCGALYYGRLEQIQPRRESSAGFLVGVFWNSKIVPCACTIIQQCSCTSIDCVRVFVTQWKKWTWRDLRTKLERSTPDSHWVTVSIFRVLGQYHKASTYCCLALGAMEQVGGGRGGEGSRRVARPQGLLKSAGELNLKTKRGKIVPMYVCISAEQAV